MPRSTPRFRLSRVIPMAVWCLVGGATTSALRPEPAHAQQLYVGGGAGYSISAHGNERGIAGFVGFETGGGWGARIEGMDTISLLFLTANVTFTMGPPDGTVRPYLVGGAGQAFDFDTGDPTVTAGVGFRVESRHFGIFTEARIAHLIGSFRSRPTIFPVLGGVRVIF